MLDEENFPAEDDEPTEGRIVPAPSDDSRGESVSPVEVGDFGGRQGFPVASDEIEGDGVPPARASDPFEDRTAAVVPTAPLPPSQAWDAEQAPPQDHGVEPATGEEPPSREEFNRLAAEVRRLAQQIAHGRS